MRQLDLTQKARAVKRVDDDLAAESYGRAKGEPDAVAVPMLTPRVATLRLHARNPSTGLPEIITVESTAPNASMRQRMTAEAGRLAGGIPWGQLPFMDAAYLLALARVLVQCSELAPDKRWLLDDVGAVLALQEALVTHDRRYFLGVDAAGAVRPGISRVECPWPDAVEPPDGGADAG